jgi:repressor LexA
MLPLTSRQAEILAWIRQHIDREGMPPTRAELARGLGFSAVSSAEDHLRALEKKGVIEMLPGASRGIRLIGGGGLPLIGRVAAGRPILAEQHIERHYQLDPALFKPHADYLLRVRGASMRDAGILDGDLLAVHRTADVRSGQVVVARLGDEVTVKRLKRRGQSVELCPENPEFEPIVVDLRREALVIEGLGVGVIRNGKAL